MAKTYITLLKSRTKSESGGALPIANAVPAAGELMTPSGTSQASATVAGEGSDQRFWQITTDTDIWVVFGTGTPVAAAVTAGAGGALAAAPIPHLMLAGTTREFHAVNLHKVAVITA